MPFKDDDLWSTDDFVKAYVPFEELSQKYKDVFGQIKVSFADGIFFFLDVSCKAELGSCGFCRTRFELNS